MKLVYKNFPLRNHQYAKPAAVAARAAYKQGKFWEFHDELFANYNRLNNEKIEEIARKLGLNMDRYNQDKNDPETIQVVNQDLQDGIKAGVRGTPTILVNGKLLRERSMQGFQDIINKELSKLRRGK